MEAIAAVEEQTSLRSILPNESCDVGSSHFRASVEDHVDVSTSGITSNQQLNMMGTISFHCSCSIDSSGLTVVDPLLPSETLSQGGWDSLKVVARQTDWSLVVPDAAHHLSLSDAWNRVGAIFAEAEQRRAARRQADAQELSWTLSEVDE